MSLGKMQNSTETMGQLFRFGLLIVVITISYNAKFATADGDGDRVALPPAPFRFYQFNVETVNYTVNCQTKPIITVNGMFPGPVIYANDGDRVIVNVSNNSPKNMTIHFHGIRQEKSPWMDGVAYITMCPIPSGGYFVHDFVVTKQKGTLLWHAHISWERATVHGAFIIYPNIPYPFPKPYKEVPVILAEWWYRDVEEVVADGLASGTPFQDSDAMVINGHPGPTYNCSEAEGFFTLKAKRGKTYLLRVINANLNVHLYFAVANHTLTVVEADASYVQPFETQYIFLSPGQTTNVLITADKEGGTYMMSVNGYGREELPVVKPVGLFKYSKPSKQSPYPFFPILPGQNSTGQVFAFTNALRTLYPGRVPQKVNRRLLLAVGLNLTPCQVPPLADNCTGLRAQGSVNNITFEEPAIALLQASYFNISKVFSEDFPDFPPSPYDYTSPASPPAPFDDSVYATKVIPIKFDDTVQIALQDTMVLEFENHPFHLHGQNFYILGQGFGNYVPQRDDPGLNTYDPPLRNTVAIPSAGWAVIRIKANNPGMWLFHCHLDKHTVWGMQTVLHVHNGIGSNNSYNPPPKYLTPC